MKYKCPLCGYIFDEEKEGISIDEWSGCPVCGVAASEFKPVEEETSSKTVEDESNSTVDIEKDDDNKSDAVVLNRKFRCPVCGYIFDEEKEGIPIEEWIKCPVCGVPASEFVLIEEKKDNENKVEEDNGDLISYPEEFEKTIDDEKLKEVDTLSTTATSIISAMATTMAMPSWDDILILGNQLNPAPLDEEADVDTTTVIGKNAEKPLVIDNPVFVSHMSYGALSEEAKISLSMGSSKAKTAMCSGEGGILPEEKKNAYKYIFEYVPNKYSVSDENLRSCDAIEIKIGQGTKPGMGGLLPADKVTEDIAKIRGKNLGEDIVSPSKFPEINSKDDLKDLVDMLRSKSDGRPIGIKIAAGRIEDDFEHVTYAMPDFITIDGRGGATGASPSVVRDSTSLPTVYALSRARKYLDEKGLDIDLVITGGLRVSSDFAKALAMGADAVAVATSSLVSLGCRQYKACNKGMCPVGIATQDKNLRRNLNVDVGAQRVANYFNTTLEELKTFARITGHDDIHDLNIDDLVTINKEISEYTNIKHA